jgi:hypothetical protein
MSFPSQPWSNGQIAVVNNITYTYNSSKTAWVRSTTGPVVISNANVSTSTTSGALTVTGGVGIGGNLYVGQNINIPNNKGLAFTTTNGNIVSFSQQSDDNFVMYSTNTSGVGRAIWSIQANSNNSNLSVASGVNLTTSNLYLRTNSNIYWANGTVYSTGTGSGSGSGTVNSGTAGQISFYSSTGTAVSGTANATLSVGQLTLGVASTAAGSLRLSGAAGGVVTIQTANPAGTYTLTLPAGTGTVGQYLRTDGAGTLSWNTITGGTGSPGGAATQIQYNDGTNFAGSANFVYDSTNTRVGIGTSAPGQRLHVVGTTYLGSATTATTGMLALYSDGVNDVTIEAFKGNDFTTKRNILLQTYGSASAGNVGIGTSAVTSKLTVAGTVHSTTGGFKFPDNTTQTTAIVTATKSISGSYTITTSDNQITLEATSTTVITLGSLASAVKVDIVQTGTGTVTIVGTNLNSRVATGTVYLSAQYAGCTVYNNSGGTLANWVAVGDISAT